MPPAAVPRFGEIEDPEQEWEDIDPFPFTLVGYDAETRESREFAFEAIGRLSLGATWDLLTAVGPNGKVDNQRVADFLAKNIVAQQRGRFFDTISDDTLLFHVQALVDLADWLREKREEQLGRPTGPSNGSRRGPRSVGRTSTAASSSRASDRSRSR